MSRPLAAVARNTTLYTPSLVALVVLGATLAVLPAAPLTAAGQRLVLLMLPLAAGTLLVQALTLASRAHLRWRGLRPIDATLEVAAIQVLVPLLLFVPIRLAATPGTAATAAATLVWSVWVAWAAGLGALFVRWYISPALQKSFLADRPLESLVGSGGYLDPLRTVTMLQTEMFRVAHIQFDDESGTGVLIGPDLVLTAFHVVENAFLQRLPGTEIRATFQGAALPFTLAHSDWLVGHSPLEQDDWAVVRLARAVDEDLVDIPLPPLVPGRHQQPRGHARVDPPGALEADAIMLVLLHADRGPLVLSVGPVKSVNGSFFEHAADTEPGGSGGPCYGKGLRLGGLHRAGKRIGSPTNQGILLTSVKDAILRAVAGAAQRSSATPAAGSAKA